MESETAGIVASHRMPRSVHSYLLNLSVPEHNSRYRLAICTHDEDNSTLKDIE